MAIAGSPRALLADAHPREGVRASLGQIDAIEALRAVAVTWVVLFHYLVVRDSQAGDPWNAWIAGAAPANAIVRNGYLGVDLFFLISGFLLVLPWARHAAGLAPAPRASEFYARRVWRIVPAYYVHLLLLFLVFLPIVFGSGYARSNGALVAVNAAAHAVFLHYTTPVTSASLSLNGALWSLTLEAQFYLLLPLLAPLFVRAALRWAAALLALALAWRWLATNDLGPLVAAQMALGARWDVPEAVIRHLLFTQLPGYLGHFAAGMAMGTMWARRSPAAAPPAGRGLVAIGAALAALYWAYGLGGGAVLGPYGSWLVTLAGLSLVFAVLAWGGPAARLVSRRPVLFVGRISYSIYLYHVPLLLVWNRFRILEGSALSMPLYLLLVLLVGWLSYELVERRFRAGVPRAGG